MGDPALQFPDLSESMIVGRNEQLLHPKSSESKLASRSFSSMNEDEDEDDFGDEDDDDLYGDDPSNVPRSSSRTFPSTSEEIGETERLLPSSRVAGSPKRSRSDRLLMTTYGPGALTSEIKRNRRKVLRQVEKDVHQHERKEKNKLLRAMFRAQQISEADAKGAFTPNPQMFGTTSVKNPNESTFCLVLAKTRYWKSRFIEVKALHALIINQLTISGLRCSMLPESPFMQDAGVVLIGIKATMQQLAKELEHKNTENSLRSLSIGHGAKGVTPDLEALSISPAEEILLTKRIINRALEVLRVRQGEKEKYLVNGVSCGECLTRSLCCCMGCVPGQKYERYVDLDDVRADIEKHKSRLRTFKSLGDPVFEEEREVDSNDEDEDEDPELQRLNAMLHRSPLTINARPGEQEGIIKQVFALHDREVNEKLWKLFLKQLFCGLCCNVHKVDHYPMLPFCDEIRYHYGNETAVFFAFAAFTLVNLFILSLFCVPLGLSLINFEDPRFDAISRGALGIVVLLLWAPVYLRMWDREYAVLVVRWALDDGDQLYENPHDASFEWVYDERLHRRLRRYDKACRPFVKAVFLPLSFVFLLLAMLDQTLFALWGAHQMTLPSCESCNYMMDLVAAGPEAYYSSTPRPSMPYDRFWYGEGTSFAQERTFEEFTFGWANLNNATKNERDCLPQSCEQRAVWWGTCWDDPAGLLPATPENDGTGVGSPFIPFIMLTVLLMRPISSIFQAVYEMLIRALTKLENWPTLEKYNVHYTQRRFLSYFLDVFWFNIIVVFILVRFGPAIMHEQLEICTGTLVRAEPNPVNNTVERLLMIPYETSPENHGTPHASSSEPTGFAFMSFVDWWYEIPISPHDISLGVWNPANVLITGEWVGLVFDLVLLRLNFLNMVFWCGFFPAMVLKCQRCRRRCCCRKLQDRSEACRRFCCTIDLVHKHDTLLASYDDHDDVHRQQSTKLLQRQSELSNNDDTDNDDVHVAQPSDDAKQQTNASTPQASTTPKSALAKGVEDTGEQNLSQEVPEGSGGEIEPNMLLAKSLSAEDLAAKLAATAAMAADLRKRRTTSAAQWQALKIRKQNSRERASTAGAPVLPSLETQNPSHHPPAGKHNKIHPASGSSVSEVPPSNTDLSLDQDHYDPSADMELQASMELLSQLRTVSHLRGFNQDELLRLANLNELHDCDGAISYLKVVSHAATVMIFSMFFPLLVPIVFLGLTADVVAEMVGMFSASKYTVLPHTGAASANAWRWTMTVSLFAAIPLVFSYFSFSILEILQCNNPKFYGDGTTGDDLNVGQTFCFDANYNNWSFNHAPYAVAWLAMSFVSFIWVQTLLSLIPRTPSIVKHETSMRDLISQSGSENEEMTHGLSVAQVPQLRTIYDHADEMLRMPGQGRPGDGEVPLDNIKRAISTLTNFHKTGASKENSKAQRSRTSVFRHENEAYNMLYGDINSLSKEESRMLMATTLLFDPDSSGTTQFVEFTLGIRNLRQNAGQLALFGVSRETLDANIANYARMLEDLKENEGRTNDNSPKPVLLHGKHVRRLSTSAQSEHLFKQELRRLSVQNQAKLQAQESQQSSLGKEPNGGGSAGRSNADRQAAFQEKKLSSRMVLDAGHLPALPEDDDAENRRKASRTASSNSHDSHDSAQAPTSAPANAPKPTKTPLSRQASAANTPQEAKMKMAPTKESKIMDPGAKASAGGPANPVSTEQQ